MEGLVGPDVKIILFVKEGRGFEFVQTPLIVVSSLEGHALDTNIIEPAAEPQFGAELTWESDKLAVRRLRTGKVPLKVECFSVVNPHKRNKLGFIILNLCSAFIQPREKNKHKIVPETWHKLVGRSNEGSGFVPELLLSLQIADVTSDEDVQECINRDEFSSQGDYHLHGANVNPTPLTTHPMTGGKSALHVGPPLMATDIFQLTIEVESSTNLEAIVGKATGAAPADYLYFKCKIFGHELKLEYCSNINALMSTQQKIVIPIYSTLLFLHQYLETSSVCELSLMSGSKELAASRMDINTLIPTKNINEFLEHYAVKGTILTKNTCLLNPVEPLSDMFDDISVSSVDVKLQLQHCGSIRNSVEQSELTAARSCPPDASAGFSFIAAAGDRHHVGDDLPSHDLDLHRLKPQLKKPQSAPVIPSKKFVTQLASQSEQCLREPKFTRVYSTFSLDISLENVLLHNLPPQNRIFFKFHHPKAEIITSTHPEVVVSQTDKMMCLENIKCKLRFVSTQDEISRLLLAWPPKISMCTMESNTLVELAIATLDVGRLLIEKKKCIYPAPMIDLSNGCEIGSLYIAMNLENCEEQIEDRILRPMPSDQELGPAILDDRITYQTVLELEEWKDRQQELFKAQLAGKEESHLKILVAEFQKRRNSMERKLNRKLEENRLLTENLQKAVADIQARANKQAETELALSLQKEELERKYNMKFQELREASKRLEEDMAHKVKLMQRDNTELLSRIETLEKEKGELQSKLEDPDNCFDKSQRSSLTKDQTTAILTEMKLMEEKLESAKKSKSFFKDQWEKAVREIHSIKNQQHEVIQTQIQDFKEELKSLGFKRLLTEEISEQQDDGEIIRQLKSSLNKGFKGYENYSGQLDSMFPQTTRSTSSSKDEIYAKITQLVHERDQLLKTGSYSMDDEAIDQINKEIRRLQSQKS